MREIRTYGSEGGGLQEMALPLPLSWDIAHRAGVSFGVGSSALI